ncbi:MAG: hypothetical protein GEU78_04980 [Actinobacteria bacterium]|nr:hypothetical protein [Actinomycetota bacterium]
MALGLAACGGGGPDPQEDPQAALTSAFDALKEAEGITMTVSVRSDTGSIQAMSEGSLSEEDAQKVLDSSITITGRNETDPEKAQAEMSIDMAGIDDALEMKFIGTTMYLRGAVRDIMELFGGNPDDADRFVADGETAGIDWARPAVEGEWLKIEGLDELGKQFVGAADMDRTAAQQQEALNELSNLIERNAKAEAGDKEGPGDHLIVTLDVRDFYDGFQEIAGSLGAMMTAGLPPAAELPDEDVVFDLWIDDDFVQQMELDFLQFADFEGADIPEGVEQAALRLTFEEFDDEVEAPEDATTVDSQELSRLFGGMGSPGGGTPGDQPTDICEQLKGAPPEVIEQSAEECPELQPN